MNTSLGQPTWVDQEDARKLHAEINSLSNQRVVLTTLSITVFLTGNVALISSFDATGQGARLLALFSGIIGVFLYTLCSLSNTLRHVSRCEAGYLVARGLTNWETPWRQFRAKRKYYSLASAQKSIFITLLAFQALVPSVVTVSLAAPLIQRLDLWTVLFVASPGVLCLVLAGRVVLAERAFETREDEAMAQWSSILRDSVLMAHDGDPASKSNAL